MYRILLFLSLVFAMPTYVQIEVKGMVCSFCAQGIKKNISKLEAVDNVKVDLKKGVIIITIKDKVPLDLIEVRKIITDSGYQVVE